MRKRISITIRTDLLSQVDALVSGVQIRNRSHALETLLEKALGVSVPEVYMLVGDEACLRRVLGAPVFEHTIRLLKKQGFEKIALGAVVEAGGSISGKCGDGHKFGVNIRYIEQRERGGTALALKQARGQFADTFMLIYGDNVFNFDLKDLIAFHKSTNSMATLALTSVHTPSRYGVAELKGNKVVRFIEKPGRAESYIVSTGIFVFEPKIFDYIGEEAKSLEKDVLTRLAETGKLSGYVMHGFWSSLDTEWELQRSEEELRKLL